MGSALTAVVLGDVFYADDGSPKIVAFRFNDVVEYHDDNHTGGGRANIKPARQANKADANNAHSSESKHSVDLGGMSTNKIGTNHRVAGEPNVNSNSVVVGVRGSDDGGGDTAAHVASAADAAFTSGGVGGAKIRNTSIAANTSNNDSNNGTTHDANSIRNIRNYNYNYNYANQSGDDHLRKTNNAPVGYGQQQFGIVPQIKLEFGGDNVGHTEPSRSNVNNNTIVGVSDIQQQDQQEQQEQQEQQQYYHQQHPLALHRQYRQQSSVNTNGQALLAPNVGNYATANANNMFVHNEHTTAATTTAASTTTSSRPTTRTSATTTTTTTTTTTQLPPSTTSTKSALTSATPAATIAVSAAAESSRTTTTTTTTTTGTTTTSTMTTDEETGVAFDAPTNDLPLSPFDFVTETVPTLDMGAAHTFTGAESLMWDTEQLDSVIGDFLHSQILHQT